MLTVVSLLMAGWLVELDGLTRWCGVTWGCKWPHSMTWGAVVASLACILFHQLALGRLTDDRNLLLLCGAWLQKSLLILVFADTDCLLFALLWQLWWWGGPYLGCGVLTVSKVLTWHVDILYFTAVANVYVSLNLLTICMCTVFVPKPAYHLQVCIPKPAYHQYVHCMCPWTCLPSTSMCP